MNYSRAKSLWVINYFNSCGFMELLPWVSSGYDMERFGILPTASARHADVLIVSGYITTKGAKRVKLIYDQMPSPKWVICMGDCSISGGPFYESYSTAQNIDEIFPIDVYIPGCPPRPEALIQGFVELQKKIAAKEDRGTEYKR